MMLVVVCGHGLTKFTCHQRIWTRNVRLTSFANRSLSPATCTGNLARRARRSGAARRSRDAGKMTKTDCSNRRVKSKPSRQARSTTGPKAASAEGAQRGAEVFMAAKDV